MHKRNIVIFGTSKIAEIVYDSLMNDMSADLNPVAFCVDAEFYCEKEKFGLPVIKFEEVERFYAPEDFSMLIAIGYHDMNRVRARKCEEAIGKGYHLSTYIHSNVVVPPSAVIGINTIILNDVSIGAFARIGNDVCIISNAVIGHHATIKDHVWITSGTVIGGNTTIGERCFLGINSTVAHNIKLGDHNFIGTNAIITRSTEAESVYIVPDTPKYKLNTDQFMRLVKFD